MKDGAPVRWQLILFLAASLLAVGTLGSSAFQVADLETRAISVAVVGDGSAYLAVQPNAASPHDCFVSDTTSGIVIAFGATDATCGADGGGSGINAGDGSDANLRSRYAFHDLLLVTNKGTKPVTFWANATTSSGGGSAVDVAKAAASGQMDMNAYASQSATGIPLAVGSQAYVGVRVTSGTLTSASSVTGAITLEARLT